MGLYEIILSTLDISDLKLQLEFFNKELVSEVFLHSPTTKRYFKVLKGRDIGGSWRVVIKRMDTNGEAEISIQSLAQRLRNGLWVSQEMNKRRKLDI